MIKVLFDHNMPPLMARALNVVIEREGHEAFALRDKFAHDIRDVDLYAALGRERNWVVISKDVAQAKRRPEREAILQSRVVALFLAPAVEKLPIAQQLATILWHWQAIVQRRETDENGLFLLPINKKSKFRSL